MKRILYNLFIFIIYFLFVLIINIFYKSNPNNQLGINIVISLNLIISLLCFVSTSIIFKKNNLENNFNKNIKNAIANSFFVSSIISISIALIIYTFLKDILHIINLKSGLINYTIFASKIWFISSPFIGLEITILKYFYELNSYKKILIISFIKLLIFCILGMAFYFKYPSNFFIYAKPFCDIIFLFYYSKICFELTLKKIEYKKII